MPAAVDICQRQGHSFDFIVQINHDEFDAITTRAAQALRLNQTVSPIIGPMDLEEYYRVLDFCDVVLLPYDPSMYRFRGSGLFAEAVAYGKPVIVSAGTAMENAADRGDCVARICELIRQGLGVPCARSLRADVSWRHKQRSRLLIGPRPITLASLPPSLAFAQRDPVFVASTKDWENEDTEGKAPDPWPNVGTGIWSTFDPPLSIQASRRIEFIPQGLHSSKGLVVDVGPDPHGAKVDVAVALELNGHALRPITIHGKRGAHFIAGPFPFLKDGLPTTLRVGVIGGRDEISEPLLHGFHYLPAPWHRSLVRRHWLGKTGLKQASLLAKKKAHRFTGRDGTKADDRNLSLRE